MISDFIKYKRFFAFGCSFTRHLWPSWPDILRQELSNAEFHNFGKTGSGNLQIACKISEAHNRFKFCETDLVMVMWSSFIREDRFINGMWMGGGNVYNNSFYDNNFCKKYVDPAGFALRDMTLIHMVKTMLEGLPCTSIMLKSYPFLNAENHGYAFNWSDNSNIERYLKERYESMYNSMPVSLCEFSYPNFPYYNDNWAKVAGYTYEEENGKLHADPHPTPIKHYEYLQHIGFNLSDKAKEYAYNVDTLLKTLKTKIEIENNFSTEEWYVNYQNNIFY